VLGPHGLELIGMEEHLVTIAAALRRRRPGRQERQNCAAQLAERRQFDIAFSAGSSQGCQPTGKLQVRERPSRYGRADGRIDRERNGVLHQRRLDRPSSSSAYEEACIDRKPL
jgi:hypothetical protein